MKKILLYSCFILFTSCSYENKKPFDDPQIQSTDVKVTDKVAIRTYINNSFNHELEYKYIADRGQIISNNSLTSTALYYAPFTGGTDTIRVSVFDKTENINLPVISQQVFVQGESIAYVEMLNTGSDIEQTENGLIKVASVRGAINRKEVGWGRNPVISPDGRFVAYVTYPGDGSSQIIVKDPVGNEMFIIKDDKSLNLFPSWSKVNRDGNLYLVFSSNRGIGIFHLWTINVNGTDLKQITNGENNDFEPSWSPDNSKIAFTSDSQDKKINNLRNLWLLDYNSNNKNQITFETTENSGIFNPEWSSDSKKIVYSRKYQKKELESTLNLQKIWVIDITKENQGFGQLITIESEKNLTETSPSWSPDNKSISFLRYKGYENSLVSLDIVTKINTENDNNKAIPEGDIKNVIETKWARQRSFGYIYNNTGLNNPFEPQN